MKSMLGRLVIGMVPGVIASIIAIIITWNYMTGSLNHNGERPCEEKHCFVKISERVSLLEEQFMADVNNKYRVKDAQRDHAIITEYIDKTDKMLRDDITAIKQELLRRSREHQEPQTP